MDVIQLGEDRVLCDVDDNLGPKDVRTAPQQLRVRPRAAAVVHFLCMEPILETLMVWSLSTEQVTVEEKTTIWFFHGKQVTVEKKAMVGCPVESKSLWKRWQ